MEFVEFKGKTLDEALMQASVELGCASTDLEYNVVSEGSTGFLGLIGSKPFVISARKKKTFVDDEENILKHYSRLWIFRLTSRSSLTRQTIFLISM